MIIRMTMARDTVLSAKSYGIQRRLEAIAGAGRRRYHKKRCWYIGIPD